MKSFVVMAEIAINQIRPCVFAMAEIVIKPIVKRAFVILEDVIRLDVKIRAALQEIVLEIVSHLIVDVSNVLMARALN